MDMCILKTTLGCDIMNSPYCDIHRCKLCVFHDECDGIPQNKPLATKSQNLNFSELSKESAHTRTRTHATHAHAHTHDTH